MTATPTSQPADPRQKVVAILVNPTAGSRPGGEAVRELVEALRGEGFEPLVCGEREDLTAAVGDYGPDLRCVVAAGGDGTLAEVLNRAPGLPVAVLPLGNENLVARYFRLGRSGRLLAETIARGRVRRLDLARAGDRLFSVMAGVGFDAEVVHHLHRGRRGQISKLNYARPMLHAWTSYTFPVIEVAIEETGERLRGATVFVFNLPRYALGIPIAPRARADDGLLDLCVCERPGRRHLLRYLWSCLRGRHERLPDYHRRLVRRVRLTSEDPVPLQTDGDPAGSLPAMIEVVPGALTLLVPSEG
jgi:diacylglycerol kinase family enzyme